MISIIIHVDDSDNIEQTVKSVLMGTPISYLSEILLIDDTGILEFHHPAVRVLTQDTPLGRSRARNRGATEATGEVLIFLNQHSKPDDDWVLPLVEVLREDPRTVAGPTTMGLDPNLWSAEPGESLKWSWGWDLSPRRAYDDGGTEAVCLGGDCLAVMAEWFHDLGGFDEQARGGEQLEFCLKSWLCGGRVVAVRSSRVATIGANTLPDTITSVRTAEAWLGPVRDRYYRASCVPTTTEYGNLSQLARVSATLQQRKISWLLDRHLPELGRIWDLRGRHQGQSVAVVCDGPSLDKIDRWAVQRHDVVLGVDYLADMFDCQYVLSLQREPVRHILQGGRYRPGQLVLPAVLLGPDGRGMTATREVVPVAVTYELGEPGVPPKSLDPPFVNYGHPVLTAVQFAAFLGAREVVLYGWDGRVVDGLSHSAAVSHYNGGRYWEDGEATRLRYQYYNTGLEQLRGLLAGRGVPVLKVSYA